MSSSLPPNNAQKAWQHQDVEALRMSLEQIGAEARWYNKKTRLLNLMTYAGYAVMVSVYVWLILHPRGVARQSPITASVAMTLVLAGMCYTVYRLQKEFRALPLPTDSLITDCSKFHRRQLAQRRDYWRTMWWWAMAPLIPGFAMGVIVSVMNSPDRRRFHSIVILVLLVFFYRAWNGFHRRAAQLQHRIDILDRMGSK